MRKQNDKQRIFEVMQRLDKTFKPKLNESDDPCWDDYEQYGTKEKDGKEVPNCVPTNEELNIQEQQTRPIYDIAQEIYQDWRPVHPYAKDYLDAMTSLNSIDDRYMFDSGREIVTRFLSNASQWKGENAKRIKAELKNMLGLRENGGLNEENSIRNMNDIEFKERIREYVNNGDFDSFHYLFGNTYNEKRHDLITHFIFDFDADYSFMKHLFNELTKIKDSGFWTNSK